MAPVTVAAALATAVDQLTATSPSARLDAQVLLAHALECDTAWLVGHADAPLTAAQRHVYDEFVARRRDGQPVAYLTGTREFWSLALRVTPDVLIPRPETELVVERALAGPAAGGFHVLDLGTGSGAIAVAIASERPAWRITAVDSSPAALAVARDNAQRFAADNIEFARSDWFGAVTGRRFDLIVANPPYVASGDPNLASGDLRFEPQAALRAGEDGLRELRRIVRAAAAHLAPDGRLILEHGFDQQSAVASLLMARGYREIACFSDHAGQPRVTECRPPSPRPR